MFDAVNQGKNHPMYTPLTFFDYVPLMVSLQSHILYDLSSYVQGHGEIDIFKDPKHVQVARIQPE